MAAMSLLFYSSKNMSIADTLYFVSNSSQMSFDGGNSVATDLNLIQKHLKSNL
jgi:hypothetical protein